MRKLVPLALFFVVAALVAVSIPQDTAAQETLPSGCDGWRTSSEFAGRITECFEQPGNETVVFEINYNGGRGPNHDVSRVLIVPYVVENYRDVRDGRERLGGPRVGHLCTTLGNNPQDQLQAAFVQDGVTYALLTDGRLKFDDDGLAEGVNYPDNCQTRRSRPVDEGDNCTFYADLASQGSGEIRDVNACYDLGNYVILDYDREDNDLGQNFMIAPHRSVNDGNGLLRVFCTTNNAQGGSEGTLLGAYNVGGDAPIVLFLDPSGQVRRLIDRGTPDALQRTNEIGSNPQGYICGKPAVQ